MVATMRRPVQQRVQPVRRALDVDQEATVTCPRCKDIQTVLIHNGGLVRTRKFSQIEGGIFHDCGSTEPCRILSKVAVFAPAAGN